MTLRAEKVNNTVRRIAVLLTLLVVASALIVPSVLWTAYGTAAASFAGGSGTSADPYLISTPQELEKLAEDINAGGNYKNQYFCLTNDIDLSGYASWTPIGAYSTWNATSKCFSGIFDGNGYTISNVSVYAPTSAASSFSSFTGLFGYVKSGIIKDLKVSNITLTNDSVNNSNHNLAMGGIAGQASDSKIINCEVDGLTVNQNKTTFSLCALGGIVGDSLNGTYISNCRVSGNLSSSALATNEQNMVGGIIGRIRSNTNLPQNCVFTGSLAGNRYVAPIVGGYRPGTDNTATQLSGANETNEINSYYHNATFTNASGGSISSAYNLRVDTNGDYDPLGVEYTDTAALTTLLNSNTINSSFIPSGASKRGWALSGTNPVLSFLKVEISDDYATDTLSAIVNGSDGSSITYEWKADGVVAGTSSELIYSFSNETLTNSVSYTLTVSQSGYTATAKYTINPLVQGNISVLSGMFTANVSSERTISNVTYLWYADNVSTGITTQSYTLPEGSESITLKVLVSFTYNGESYTLTMEKDSGTVIFIDAANGIDTNDGTEPYDIANIGTGTGPVKTFKQAYTLLSSDGSTDTNTIVVCAGDGTGYYEANYDTAQKSSIIIKDYQDVFSEIALQDKDTFSASDAKKEATITGKYDGVTYAKGITVRAAGSSSDDELDNRSILLMANTAFENLEFSFSDGNGVRKLYFYCNGFDLTMGEGISFSNISNFSPSQSNGGLSDSVADGRKYSDVQIIGASYDSRAIDGGKENTITIESGSYARIIGGGRSGNTFAEGLAYENNTGSYSYTDIPPENEMYNSTINIGGTAYISLVVGGQTDRVYYGNSNINITDGFVYGVVGGSIGYNQTTICNSGSTNMQAPYVNDFKGNVNVNISGGTVYKLYGGSLGRRYQHCRILGDININISGGEVEDDVFACGAGAIVGDEGIYADTSEVNMTVSGGTVNGNVYGGGYGYYDYLSSNEVSTRSGFVYGDISVNINGDAVINGNVFGGGKGTDKYAQNSSKTSLAQVIGTTTVTVEGNASVTGSVYGGGEGVSGYDVMGKITGGTSVVLGGSASVGGDVFGGGDVGRVSGNTSVAIIGGDAENVYGGGNQADVGSGNTVVSVSGGTVNNVYGCNNLGGVFSNTVTVSQSGATTNFVFGGGNAADYSGTPHVEISAGTVTSVFGGGNAAAVTGDTDVKITGGHILEAVVGGGNDGVITGDTYVTLDGATAVVDQAVIGAGNRAAVSGSSYILCKNGTVIGAVLGGGNAAAVGGNSSVEVRNGTYSAIIGGGNSGSVNGNTYVTVSGGTEGTVVGGGFNGNVTGNSQIIISGGHMTNVFGGGDGDQTTISNTEIDISGSAVADNVYGGGKAGNVLENTLVSINASITGNIFGGGKGDTSVVYGNSQATVNSAVTGNVYGSGESGDVNGHGEVTVNSTVSGSVYGGGYGASSEIGSTTVRLNNASVSENVFGGGNAGTVKNGTEVYASSSAIGTGAAQSGYVGTTGNIYGGGDNAGVHSTYIYIDGNTSLYCVFGGGNSGEVYGNTKIDIVSAVIETCVFGGGNQAKVYGSTEINAGAKAVSSSLTADNKLIIGNTVAGGGNTPGAGTAFDARNPYVYNGTTVNIVASGYNTSAANEFTIGHSVYGDGNKCVVQGTRTVLIKDYGTAGNKKTLLSLQRADTVTLESCYLEIIGTPDTANMFNTTDYTLNRINELIVKNDTVIYLRSYANMLCGLSSVNADNSIVTKAQVDNGESKNALYIQQGKNIDVRKSESVSNPVYGDVKGMAKLGAYDFEGNDITAGVYVLGSYYNSYGNTDEGNTEQAAIHGFVSDFTDSILNTGDLIIPQSNNSTYRLWWLGSSVTVKETKLTASPSNTTGREDSIDVVAADGSKYLLELKSLSFVSNVSGQDFYFVDPSTITNDTDAYHFGLTLKTGMVGWTASGNGISILGDTQQTDNSAGVLAATTLVNDGTKPQLILHLDCGKLMPETRENVTGAYFELNMIKTLPDGVQISTGLIQVTTTIDWNAESEYNNATADAGKKYTDVYNAYDILTSPKIEITSHSSATVQFVRSYYTDSTVASQTLSFSTVTYTDGGPQQGTETAATLPAGLKMVLVDRDNDTPAYYYYITDGTESSLSLTDFILMGSSATHYAVNTSSYGDVTIEEYLLIFDFSQTDGTFEADNFRVTLSSKDSESVLVSTYSITSSGFKITDTTPSFSLDSELDNTVYQSNSVITVSADIDTMLGGAIDTTYNEKALGIEVTLLKYDTATSTYSECDFTKGIAFKYANEVFQPIGSTCVIKIADYIASTKAKIEMDMTGYTALETGQYMISLQLVTVSDLCNSASESEMGLAVSEEFTIRNDEYAVKVTISDDTARILTTDGKTSSGQKTVSITTRTWKTDGAVEPVMVAAVYKKNSAGEYEQVNFSSVINGWGGKEMYIDFADNTINTFTLADSLESGTYRIKLIVSHPTDSSVVYAEDVINLVVRS